MKNHLFFFTLLAGLLTLGSCNMDTTTSGSLLETGDPLPSLDVFTQDTPSPINKITLIVFLSSGCPNCVQALPTLNTIWEQYGHLSAFYMKGFSLISVESGHYSFPVVEDIDRSVFQVFAQNNIPRFYLFDRSGKLLYQSQGYSVASMERLKAEVKNALY